MSLTGRPSEVNINTIVINAELGILAAPTLARVAVKLIKETNRELIVHCDD